MTAQERFTGDSILDEAERDRKHQQQLAKIQADRDAKIAAARSETAASRHILMGVVSGILAVLALLLYIGYAWKSNVDADREKRERQLERADQVAELCIREGNLWVDGNCLIARRE